MKRKVFALLLAVSLVNVSVSPVAADDYIIEMQENPEIQEDSESQEIIFDEPEYAEENPAIEAEATADEDGTGDVYFSDETAAAGYEEEGAKDIYDGDFADEDKITVDGSEADVTEGAYNEYFADEDEALAWDGDSFIEDDERVIEEVSLANDYESIPIDEAHFPDPVFRNYIMEKFDDGNGYLSSEEINKITSIKLS